MPNSLNHAQKWLSYIKEQAIPHHDIVVEQVAAGSITSLCECGCHGFDFHIPSGKGVSTLKSSPNLFCELVFESNSAFEIVMLLFVDDRGYLSRFDITVGSANHGPMPEDIIPIKLKYILSKESS